MPKSPTQTPAPFTLDMTDDALVTLDKVKSDGTQKFNDTGYMPVNQTTIAGLDIPSGVSGMFIHYTGSGVQTATSSGIVIDFKKVHYELVGYKGTAQFGHAADGTPTVSNISDQIVLAQGDLLKNAQHTLVLDYATGSIGGDLDASMQTNNKTVGELDIKVSHVGADMTMIPGGFTLDHGMLRAVFVPLSAG